MLVLPISGIISISITYLYVEKLDYFLTLRFVIPLLIFSLIFFYLVLSKRSEIFSSIQVNKNSFISIKKIISLQAPIMPASFFSVAAVSFPVIIFGYQQNFYNVVLLGFLDRFFNPFRNAFQTIISNLHPYLFGILSKNQSEGNKELNRFSNIFLVISFFVSLSSIFFFFIFSKLTDYEPSLGLLFIFILKFISIIPLVTQMLCNVDFYSERDTVLISKLTFSRSLINLLNFYFYNFGIQWVIFIQLVSSSLPSLYSSRLINLKNEYFNKIFFKSIHYFIGYFDIAFHFKIIILMCGIIGFSFRNEELVSKGIKSIEHRGPDAFNSYLDDNISLGHSLLSIRGEVKNSVQPFKKPNSDWLLAFNGQIYNLEYIKNLLSSDLSNEKT